jgi:hypothetical protein
VALTLEAKSPLREGGFLLFGAVSAGSSGGDLSGFGIDGLGWRSIVAGGRGRLPSPALGLLEPVAVAVQLQDMDVVGETIE